MKIRILAFLVLTCMLTACSNGPVIPSEEESEAIIMKKVSSAAERWANGDPMGYVEMGAPDQTYMDDIAAPELLVGKENLKAYFTELSGGVPVHTPKLSAFYWQFYEDVIVLTYRYTGVLEGQPTTPWKVTSVWKYLDNDWLSVHENWSLVKMPEADSDMAEE